MGKSSPSAPAAPDPAATAAAQSQYNQGDALFNAKLNRIDTTTPYGSQTYGYTPPAAGSTNDPGTFSQSITLSPDQQKLYNAQTATSQQAYDLANAQFPRVASTLGSTFNPNLPGPAGPVSAGPITSTIPGAGTGIATTYGSGGDVQKGLDYSGAPGLVSGDALAQQGQNVSDAIYNSAKLNLDPRYQQEEQQVSNTLVNRGIPVGSPAFNTALSNFRQSRDTAYQQAQDSATQGGVAAANTLFGQGLAARQQSVGETTTAGQFANAAQQQAEAEAAARAGFQNSGQAQQFGQNSLAAQFANAAQAQQFGQGTTNANLQNQANSTLYNQALQQRELPLQETEGLLGTGPGVQPLNFTGPATVSAAAPNYEGDVSSTYAQQLAAYQAQQAQGASTMGGLFGALGTLGGGAIQSAPLWASLSDRSLKQDIRRVGTADNGLPIYLFRYIGGGQYYLGLMAQDVEEVIPSAVFNLNGVKLVDYDAALKGAA